MLFRAKIENYKVNIHEQQQWLDLMQELEGKDIEIIIRVEKPDRTTQQNRLYWRYLALISDYTGDEVEDLHEMLKNRFLGGKSTKELDIKSFGEYLEKIQRYASEVNIRLPLESQIDLD